MFCLMFVTNLKLLIDVYGLDPVNMYDLHEHKAQHRDLCH